MSQDRFPEANGRGHDDQAAGPIVIVTFEHAGVSAVESILVSHGVACAAGTGVVSLCAQAAATWQRVEDNQAGLSALAAASVRTLASTMITCMMAASGRSRWCEIASPRPGVGPFAKVFPQAKFVCLYRGCAEVIAAVTGASRWGLGQVGLGDVALAYPGNSVAAAAAYWCGHTQAMLQFEASHPEQTLRVRHEDLAASAAEATKILSFLGLDRHQPELLGPRAEANGIAEAWAGCPADTIPVELIPAPMLARISGLQAALGYGDLGTEQKQLAQAGSLHGAT
jgi:protein-tyrosine sulfotransferase